MKIQREEGEIYKVMKIILIIRQILTLKMILTVMKKMKMMKKPKPPLQQQFHPGQNMKKPMNMSSVIQAKNFICMQL